MPLSTETVTSRPSPMRLLTPRGKALVSVAFSSGNRAPVMVTPVAVSLWHSTEKVLSAFPRMVRLPSSSSHTRSWAPRISAWVPGACFAM